MIYTVCQSKITKADRQIHEACGMPWKALGSRLVPLGDRVSHNFPGIIVFKTEEEAYNYIMILEREKFWTVWELDTTWDNTHRPDLFNRLLKDCLIIGETK